VSASSRGDTYPLHAAGGVIRPSSETQILVGGAVAGSGASLAAAQAADPAAIADLVPSAGA